ncbi:MAG: malate dehydrogenase [Chloroflexi bacterium]|nr:malate dehydrogenase [Chloroflexota bacterium]
MRLKVTILGAGQVGASTAQRLMEHDYADVVMVDIIPGMPQGKALDIQEAAPIVGYSGRIVGTNGYEETAGSDVVVITSGIPRKPGMSRDDLVLTNQKIVTQVTEQIVARSPNAILIVLTNPVDAMTQVVYRVSGFPKRRVVGQAGILDTARFRTFVALEAGVSPRDVQAYVLGGHGDQMVPLARYCTIGGVPITEILPRERIDAIVERTRKGGEEIVKLLQTGSAFYAPSAALVEMIDAIALDQKRVLPCVAYLEGEYGLTGLFVGVPVRLGASGIEQVVEIPLTDDERAALHRSADTVRALVQVMQLSG